MQRSTHVFGFAISFFLVIIPVVVVRPRFWLHDIPLRDVFYNTDAGSRFVSSMASR
jgi:heme/copper-type cytochrome/quinol oxidase subunit 4